MPRSLGDALVLGLAALAALAVIVFSGLVARDAMELGRLEADRAELRDVRYGALDADEWVSRVTTIAARRIDNFEVTPETRPHLKALLTNLIERLITEVPRIMARIDEDTEDSFKRFFDRTARESIAFLVEASDLREKAPEIADQLIDELEQPETKKELIYLMHRALTDLGRDTFSPVDRAPLREIEARYGCPSPRACGQVLAERIESLDDRVDVWLLLLGGTALLLLGAAAVRFTAQPRTLTILLVVAAAALLGAGISAPMIQIDARIADLRFFILGGEVRFSDQVLYFRTRSILGVVDVLMRAGAFDLILVGGLVALFSVGFPVLKLLASAAIALRGGDGGAPSVWFRFFAWHAGKWAMADVFVVALFMAYIGLRGMTGHQLSQLEKTREPLEIFTTNATALEPGFWAFLLFALFGIAMGMLVQRLASLNAART